MIRIAHRASPWLLLAAAIACAAGCQDASPEFAGNELYAGNCASCHGLYGDGEGPAAASIPQTVPDLRLIAQDNGGTFPRDLIRRIIDGRELIEAHRSEVMPRWGEEFQISEGYSAAANERVDAKIDALVDFIASIQIRD